MNTDDTSELIWWKTLSSDNGEKVLKVVDILLSKLDLYGTNRLKPLIIPKIEFENVGLHDFNEVINITSRLGGTTKILKTINLDSSTLYVLKDIMDGSEEVDLQNHLIVDICSLDISKKLLEIKNDLFAVVQSYKNFFWFEGNVFVLLKFKGSALKINFNKHKSVEPTSPFYLMKALTTLLQKHGKLTQAGWLDYCIDQEELIEYINLYMRSSVITAKELKGLKGNLLKKIDADGDKLIVLEDFNKTKNGYPFRLKYPF